MDKKGWSPEMLIIGPGGMKGFNYMGALLYLEKIDWLKDIKCYVGVSVGAVLALLLTAGYTVTEIIDYSLDVSLFHDFMSIDLSQVKENSGLISNQQIKTRLSDRMIEKFGFVPTMKEFYEFTGVKFVAVTLDIDLGDTLYLSLDTDPDLSVVDAVTLSMNIPFVFYKIRYKGHVMVDGALGNPYPVDAFDDGQTNILGIYIDHTNQTNSESIASYFYFILHSMTGRLKKLAMQKLSPLCKHLIILTPITDTIGLSIDNDAKSEMIVQGYEQAKIFADELIGET